MDSVLTAGFKMAFVTKEIHRPYRRPMNHLTSWLPSAGLRRERHGRRIAATAIIVMTRAVIDRAAVIGRTTIDRVGAVIAVIAVVIRTAGRDREASADDACKSR